VHFLAPLFVLLGAGAAVPLLLHLMRRRAGARIDFPAVRYLARAEREHSRRLKLRNLLLMMVRVLAVLAIALAAARPVSRLVGRLLGAGHAPSAVAIVVDNSLSTSVVIRGRAELDRLVDAADGVLDRLTPADRAWLVTADGVVQGGTLATVREALHRVRPLGGAGDPPAAVVRAAVVASGQARSAGMSDAVVAVATDGQATTWTSPVDVGGARAVLLVPPTEPPANHAVADVEARPERWTPRGEVTARLTGVTDSAPYRIDLGGRTLARGTASAGDPTISVHASPNERGWVAGAVVLDPDELRADDVRHFAVWIGAPPTVAVDSGVGPFMRDALTTLEATGRATGGAGGIEIVTADRLDHLPALILAPSDPVRVGAGNRALERAGVPWRYGAAVRAPGDLRAVAGVAVGDDVTVSMRYALEPHGAAASDTIARAGGAAWAVGGPGYVMLASPVDPSATSLPIRASFVPWIADLLAQRLGPGAGGGGVLQAVPGTVLPRPEWADAVEGDDGTSAPLTGSTLRAPAVAGVEFLRRAGARVGALVVNGEARESDLRRLPVSAMAGLVRPAGAARIESLRDPWIAAVFEGGGGRPLATPFFLLALALLITESVLTRRRAPNR
jgi:Aerotolerance regulator N-terminal